MLIYTSPRHKGGGLVLEILPTEGFKTKFTFRTRAIQCNSCIQLKTVSDPGACTLDLNE